MAVKVHFNESNKHLLDSLGWYCQKQAQIKLKMDFKGFLIDYTTISINIW